MARICHHDEGQTLQIHAISSSLWRTGRRLLLWRCAVQSQCLVSLALSLPSLQPARCPSHRDSPSRMQARGPRKFVPWRILPPGYTCLSRHEPGKQVRAFAALVPKKRQLSSVQILNHEERGCNFFEERGISIPSTHTEAFFRAEMRGT